MNHTSATLMDDFYVLGSNVSFPSSLPGPMAGNGYHMCGQYLGTPPVGQISRITCQPQPITAQYVYIKLDRSTNPGVLEMCEVWVYGSKLTTPFLWITSITNTMHSFIAEVMIWWLLSNFSTVYRTPVEKISPKLQVKILNKWIGNTPFYCTSWHTD